MGSNKDPTAAATAEDEGKPSLPKLLASLALGARSVNALPLARETENDDNDGDDDGDEDLDDEFAFRMSLPEFASLNNEARQSLSSLLSQALEGLPSIDEDGGTNDKEANNNEEEYEFDDPELWERCADACDALQDRVADYIQRKQSGESTAGSNIETLSTAIANASARARTNATSSYTRMLAGIADMEKPQNVYQGFVTQPPQNARGEPFAPVIVYDAERQGRLEGGEFTRDGHGLESRFDNGSVSSSASTGGNGEGNDVTRRKYSPDMIAPSYHYDHPYREEIEALEYRPWQLDVSEVETKDAKQIAEDNGKDGDDGVWIGEEEDLARLAARIMEGKENGEIQEIALDLEAHSHRTFAGFVCLIQLSIRRPVDKSSASTKQQSASATLTVDTGYDFLIDALSLRHVIPMHLGPILVDPSILKVMHGADSDIPWLQRDFGCYVINLFDTGRASRALKFPSAGLAYLLRKYAGFDADKAHQLSDWRRRPLPGDMRRYAVSDTRYLLDVYDQLRLELEAHSMEDVSITSVLDRSKQVCLIRYDKEPFRPSGYLSIVDGRNGRNRRNITNKKSSKVTSELSPQQEAALKSLYDWRNRTARQEDESAHYVCPNAALLRIASNRPATVAALQRLVNPPPPLVMRRSQEILDAIKNAASSTVVDAAAADSKEEGEDDAGKKKATAATSKSAQPPTSRNREMLSPILGSEALYQRAGWMTPTLGNGSSGASESEDEGGRQKQQQQLLDVNASNQGYSSAQYSSHGIEMSPPSLENEADTLEGKDGGKRFGRSASADGLGTSRAATSSEASVHEDARVAERSAELIQKEMIKFTESGSGGNVGRFGNGFSLIDLIRPIPMSEDIDFDKEKDDTSGNDSAKDGSSGAVTAPEEEDEMVIPKSMREIYNLSNANRRRTGKEKSSKPSLQFPDTEDMKKNIQKMKEDDIRGAESIIASRGGPGGYFGSPSGGGGGSKRQRTAPGKEGDIKLMTKMGWVKDKKDAEALAVVPADGAASQQGTEKEGARGGSNHSGSSSSYNHRKSSANGGKGGGGSFDYYSNNGSMGAFDPNAAPAKNPFFAGAATSAASMLHGESSKGGKSHNKRNKKR